MLYGQKKIDIYCDGGARGNPGPAACAFATFVGGKIVFRDSKKLGQTSNNVAEYSAVIFALEWLARQKDLAENNRVCFNIDSELVVRQLNQEYKIKNEKLKALYLQVKNLEKRLGQLPVYNYIPRDKNKTADALVNLELDTPQ